MNTFTASNGYKVTPNGDGANVYRGIMSTPIYPDEMQALREFFQAKEDKRLGRWRHPDYPDIYVRPMDGHPNMAGVVKDDEAGLAYGQFSRDVRASLDPMTIVAHAYFEAHPDPEEYVIVWSGGLALTKPLTLPEAQEELKQAWDTGEIFRLVPLDVAGEEQ